MEGSRNDALPDRAQLRPVEDGAAIGEEKVSRFAYVKYGATF
jgi:hypothetical protein